VVATLIEGASELLRWLPESDGRLGSAVGFELGELERRLDEYESFLVAVAVGETAAWLDSDWERDREVGEASGSSISSSLSSSPSLSAIVDVKSRCWPGRPFSSDETELAYECRGGVDVLGICWKGWTKDPTRLLEALVTELPLVERA
jgi:hypothetical protein